MLSAVDEPPTAGTFDDLVGVGELSSRWGVSRQRVSQIAASPGFPPPVKELRMGPVWHLDQVRVWEQESGRVGVDE